MEPIEFWKMSGSGNDFILIDNRDGMVPGDQMGRIVERACRRRESVGADGVIFVTRSEEHDFAWHYFNADGGEVEMCGNGTRCVARFAYLKGIAGPEMSFDTRIGPVSARVSGRHVKVSMPDPHDLRLDIDLPPDPSRLSADFLNTGVPHVVVQVEDLQGYPVHEQGRWIRYHHMFAPEGTNANFITVLDPNNLEIRTYERGVEDETLACGTGAIAAALVASARGMAESPARVRPVGGEELTIHFQKQGDRFKDIFLEGGTTVVYQARLSEEAL